MFFSILKTKLFKNAIYLATKILRFITQFFITLSGTITLLTIELYHLVKPLIIKFSGFVTCRGKPRFVLKGCNLNILSCKIFIVQLCFRLSVTLHNKKILVQNSIINRFEYGIQIRSIYANSFFIQKNNALKKQVEKHFMNKTNIDKPFMVNKYVDSYDFVLPRLRRKCNGVSPAYFLVDSFVKSATKN
jgi:hypothetical protein